MPRNEIFNIAAPDLINLHKFYRRAPKQFGHAAAGVLNDQAFGTRRASIARLGRNLIVRDVRFANSRVQVDKAVGSQPITIMQAETGSVYVDRFSGWEEQETGKRTSRTRTQSVLARGNSRQNPVRRKYRLMGQRFTTPDDFADVTTRGNELHREIAMLKILKRNRFKKPFVLRKRRYGKGLFKLVNGTVRSIQSFEPEQVQPKRKPWLIPGRGDYFRSTNLTKVWSQQLKRQVKFKLK